MGDTFTCVTFNATSAQVLDHDMSGVLTLTIADGPQLQRFRESWSAWRWLGLILTALYWAGLVAAPAMTTAYEELGIDGPRCGFSFHTSTFRLQWTAQLLNEFFQASKLPLVLNGAVSGEKTMYKRDTHA